MERAYRAGELSLKEIATRSGLRKMSPVGATDWPSSRRSSLLSAISQSRAAVIAAWVSARATCSPRQACGPWTKVTCWAWNTEPHNKLDWRALDWAQSLCTKSLN